MYWEVFVLLIMQSFVAIHWLLMTLAMLKVWKAPGYLQTQIFPISFLMRNGRIKWIQLKSYCRCPCDSFFKLKYIICTSKPSFCLSIFGWYHYLKQSRKWNLPHKHHIFIWKTSYFENFTMYRKTQERFWGSHISKPFPKTKTKIRRFV